MKNVIVALALVLSACDPEPPRLVRECTREETRAILVPSAAAPGDGIPIGNALRIVWRTECVEWSEWQNNPEHAAWQERHR